MSTGLPKRFDPERLAAQDGGTGGVLSGELDIGQMPRLREMLASEETTPVNVELHAFRDDAKRVLLEGRIAAELTCQCQRCMEPVALPVNADFALAVVTDEETARGLPAELDPLLLERDVEVDLPALIEDELILALPPIPMHERVEDCGERARYGRTADEAFDAEAKRENPFAVLKKLKNGNTD